MTGHKKPPEKRLNWLFVSFDDLDKRDLYAALALRQHTFVVEQKLNYQDADWEDPYAIHVLGTTEGDLAVYARIFMPDGNKKNARVGRMVTAPAYRGEGYGDRLMQKIFEFIKDECGDCTISMSIQTHMQKFYAKYEFHPVGDEYLEAGTPHIRVVRQPQ